MEIKITGHIPVTGDCGHKFDVPIAGLEDEFTCPDCGAKDRFSEDQISGIRAEVNKRALAFGAEEVRKGLDETLKRVAARSKYFKYIPKR